MIASVVATGFTWPDLVSSIWAVKAIWFSSLVLAVTSVCSATQQAVAVSRLSTHPDATRMISYLLAKRDQSGTNVQLEPNWFQLYIWQIPVSLLSMSLYLYVIGLVVLLWSRSKSVNLLWMEGDTKVWKPRPTYINALITS